MASSEGRPAREPRAASKSRILPEKAKSYFNRPIKRTASRLQAFGLSSRGLALAQSKSLFKDLNEGCKAKTSTVVSNNKKYKKKETKDPKKRPK